MLIPSYSLTATERVLPKLALDFTTALLDNRITFTRSGNTATVIDSSGVIVSANADIPRFDYDPVAIVCKGLLIEEARTNLLLNSLIDGTSLTTQSVTVTAAAHTLSFYGTGDIVLSGAHSATVTGTGAYPTRTTLTFTPSAGSLTLTVTGTVQFAQLELGAFSTSFIPTDGTTKTRNADLATMTGTNFSDWYNQTEGTLLCRASRFANTATFPAAFQIDDGSDLNRLNLEIRNTTGTVFGGCVFGGVTQAGLGSAAVGKNAATLAFAYKQDLFAFSHNGTSVLTDTSGNIPTVNAALIGSRRTSGISQFLNGHIQRISYYPQKLVNAEVQAITK